MLKGNGGDMVDVNWEELIEGFYFNDDARVEVALRLVPTLVRPEDPVERYPEIVEKAYRLADAMLESLPSRSANVEEDYRVERLKLVCVNCDANIEAEIGREDLDRAGYHVEKTGHTVISMNLSTVRISPGHGYNPDDDTGVIGSK